MKKLIIFLFSIITIVSMAQEKVTCDYPVKPGDNEWRYTSYADKLQKNQPPKSLINDLNTELLLKLCIKYPFNKDVLLFNNRNYGTRKILKESMCWQEFIERKDAINTLMDFYCEYSTNEIETILDLNEKNNKKFDIYFLEKIISESEIIKKADIETRKQLLEKLLVKYVEKKSFSNEYFGSVYDSSLNAILKILIEEKVHTKMTENIEYHNLIELGICNSEPLEIEIISNAKTYLFQ